MSTETNPTSTPASGVDGKTIAIISYFTWIGWIIAYILYSSNKSQLAVYHLRQTLALMILGTVCYILQLVFLFIPGISWIMILVSIGIFVLWIIGLISAINGEQKPVPVIGVKAQEILAGIK